MVSHAIDRVAVIGGGLIGLCTAHYLREAGKEVIVLERDRVGSGASRGNMGEVCPAMCLPLPAPGVVADSLRTLLRPDSALYVRPQASLALARFLLGFAWNTRADRFARGARALAQLSSDALPQYRALQASGVEIDFNELPYLLVYGSREAAERGRQEIQRLTEDRIELGDTAMGPEELVALEPCLVGDVGGLRLNGQLTLDPSALVDRLATALRARGVEIREGARVTAIEPGAARTTVGRVEADAIVLASGIWSVPLAATIGVRLPIVVGKGYSFAVPFDKPPRHQINLESAHVVFGPQGGAIRVGGTMEFDRQHDRFNPRRIAMIVAAARPYVNGVNWDERTAEWMGPRPMTSDGLPLIGPIGEAGPVFVAAGHNMFGLTLAPSTGRAVAQLVTEGRADVDLSPFDPRRSGW
jgi:D-amino-acid dehydrogenase